MKALVNWHRQQYPAMESQDMVKLVFQAMLGCGHLLGDEQQIVRRIQEEESTLLPSTDEPLIVPLGPDYVRLNLRRAMAEGIAPQWIARMMKLSCKGGLPSRKDVAAKVDTLGDSAASAIAQRLISEPDWLPSHTQAYHTAYAPAYRVISRQCAAALPVLSALSQMWSKERLLLCIDGPCGSGKTTLARILVDVLDAALVSMDDFFLPHARKTSQRLSQPGGNADWERLVEEFLLPWIEKGHGSYRRYSCHADCFSEEILVPERKVTIIEGSYSLMPAIAQNADLRVFIQIEATLQQQRILERDGEQALQMFLNRWIPLEKAYHSAFHLPDESCLVLPSAAAGME